MKAQALEKTESSAMRVARAKRRETNLKAMYVPGGPAGPHGGPLAFGAGAARSSSRAGEDDDHNDSGVGGSSGAAALIEKERNLRRLATRGVVALFNAITQHQKEKKTKDEGGGNGNGNGTTAEDEDKKKNGKAGGKRGFVDMMKKDAGVVLDADPFDKKKKKSSAAATASATTTGEKVPPSSGSGSAWLSEKFMLDSKLKDWDKDSDNSDEEKDRPARFVKDGDDDLADAKDYDDRREKEDNKRRKKEEMEDAKKKKMGGKGKKYKR